MAARVSDGNSVCAVASMETSAKTSAETSSGARAASSTPSMPSALVPDISPIASSVFFTAICPGAPLH